MLLLVVLPALVQGNQLQQGLTAGMMLRYKIGSSERQLQKLEDVAAELNRVSKLEALETSLQQDLESWCSQASSAMEKRLAQVKNLINDKQAALEEQKWNEKVSEVCRQQRHSFEKIVDRDLPRLHHNAVQESQTLQVHLRGAHQDRGYSPDESDDYAGKGNGREEDTIEVTDQQAKATGAGNDEQGEEADEDDYSDKEVVSAAAGVSSKQIHFHADGVESDDSSDDKLLQSGEKHSDEIAGLLEESRKAEEDDGVESTGDEEAQLKLLTKQAYLQLKSSSAVANGNPKNVLPIAFVQMGMESNVFRPSTKQAKKLCNLFDNAKNSTSSSWLKPLNQAENEAKDAALALAQAKEERYNNTQGIKECQDIAKAWSTDIEQIGAVIKTLSDATTLVEGSAKVAKPTSKKIEKDIVEQHQWVLNGLQDAQDVRQKGREAQEQRAELLSSKRGEVDKTVQQRQAAKQQADDKLKQIHKQVDNIVETCKRMREEGLASLLVKGIHH